MKRHEWKEQTEHGVRWLRASRHGGKWSLQCRDAGEETWRAEEPISRESLVALREILFRKYQRRRLPYEHVVEIEKLMETTE